MKQKSQAKSDLLEFVDPVNWRLFTRTNRTELTVLAWKNLPHRVPVKFRPRVGHIRPLHLVRPMDNKQAIVRDVELSDELRAFIDNL